MKRLFVVTKIRNIGCYSVRTKQKLTYDTIKKFMSNVECNSTFW